MSPPPPPTPPAGPGPEAARQGQGGRSLEGRLVGLLEARRSQEMAHLVEQRGGQPYVVPALREVAAVDPLALRQLVDQLAEAPLAVAIFQTGVGAATLLREVSSLGEDAARILRAALAGATVLARGPKPRAALGAAGVRVDQGVPAPFTTQQILDTLQARELRGQRVLVQHHGGPNDVLTAYLRQRGAVVLATVLYRWALPQDTQPLVDLLARLQAGELDALLLTSASQVHNLFTVAEQVDQADELRQALAHKTVVAAVGPVCAQALAEHGVSPPDGVVQPENPKMVPLIDALGQRLQQTATRRAQLWPGA